MEALFVGLARISVKGILIRNQMCGEHQFGVQSASSGLNRYSGLGRSSARPQQHALWLL